MPNIPGQKLPSTSNQTSRKDMLKQLTQIQNKKNQNQIDLEKLKSTFVERDLTSKSKQKATVADPLAHEIEAGNDSFDDDSAYRGESEENEEKPKEQAKVWDDEENVMSIEEPQNDAQLSDSNSKNSAISESVESLSRPNRKNLRKMYQSEDESDNSELVKS